MERLKLLDYRAGATIIELAQALLQILGGGKGDPSRLEEQVDKKRPYASRGGRRKRLSGQTSKAANPGPNSA